MNVRVSVSGGRGWGCWVGGVHVYEEETQSVRHTQSPPADLYYLSGMMTMPQRMSLCSETVITQLLQPLRALYLHVMAVTHFTIQIVFAVVGT